MKQTVKYLLFVGLVVLPILAAFNLSWGQANANLPWQIEVVDGPGNQGQYGSLALDSLGQPHVSYFDDTANKLVYGVKTATGWTLERLDPIPVGQTGAIASSNDLRATQIAIGNNDTVYLTAGFMGVSSGFCEDAAGDINNVKCDLNIRTRVAGGSWSYDRLSQSIYGNRHSLALKGGLISHILYQDSRSEMIGGVRTADTTCDANFGERCLLHENRSRFGWLPARLVFGKQVVGKGDIAVDSSGRVHIVFVYKRSEAGLTGTGTMVQYCMSEPPDAIDNYTAWNCPTDSPNAFRLNSDETVAGSTAVSLALDSSAGPHICIGDAFEGSLKYMTKFSLPGGGTAWYAEPVRIDGTADSTDNLEVLVGTYCQIAVGPGDVRHIAYADLINQKLKYARQDPRDPALAWEITDIDTQGSVGWFPSIAIHSDGVVHVSYYATSGANLKHAWLSPCGNQMCEMNLGETFETCPADCTQPPTPPPDCTTNTDCPGLSACINGTCQNCTDNAQCEAGRICQNGACIVPPTGCTTNDECPGGALCVEGSCVSCAADADCGEGMVCLRGACLTTEQAQSILCGNGACNPGETFQSCPADCMQPSCGNGQCQADLGETNATCPNDCPTLPALNEPEAGGGGRFGCTLIR